MYGYIDLKLAESIQKGVLFTLCKNFVQSIVNSNFFMTSLQTKNMYEHLRSDVRTALSQLLSY